VAEPYRAAGELISTVGPEGKGTEGRFVKFSKVLGFAV
jgi:hypothetical protein